MDRDLYLEGEKSWSPFIYKSTENMKINISKLSTDDISKIVNNYYKKSVEDQLKIFKNQTTDSKLNTFANCYNEFSLQSYLDLNLSKFIVKNLTKLRISALTDNGQKYSLASNFPYVFHLNILIFNKPGKHLKDNFTFNNNTIECVNDYKYLGMKFTSSGIFKQGKEDMYKKSLKAVFKSGLAGKYQWREFPVVITGKYRPGKYSKF